MSFPLCSAAAHVRQPKTGSGGRIGVGRSAKPMHASGPLKGHDQPLETRQERQSQCSAANGEHGKKHERLRAKLNKIDVQQRRHKVTDNQHRQPCRTIISALMRQVFAAVIAGPCHREIAAEHMAFAAIRAAAEKSTTGGKAKRTVFDHAGLVPHGRDPSKTGPLRQISQKKDFKICDGTVLGLRISCVIDGVEAVGCTSKEMLLRTKTKERQ